MLQPPLAKKIPVTQTYHQTRILQDDYAWMKQENWREMFADTSLLDPDIKAYLEAENAYTEQQLLAPNRDLIDRLINEMKARVEIDYDTTPVQDGAYAYFVRQSAADYPIFLRRDQQGREQVLLDVNGELAQDGRKVFLGDLAHSRDHRLLAVAVDYSGAEDHDIFIKDIATGERLADILAHADGIVWHPDNNSFYYTKMSDAAGEFRRDRVFLHRLGDAQDQDQLVFTNNDPAYFLATGQTTDRRFLAIEIRNAAACEIHLLDMQQGGDLICLSPRSDGILYDVDHSGGILYIHTNADGATEFKVMTAPLATPRRAHWQEFIAAKPGCLIASVTAFAGHLLQADFENALPRLTIHDLTTRERHDITFEDPAYHAGAGIAAGFASEWMRLIYSSPRMPTQYYNYNMRTRERVLMRQEKIPGHHPEDYVVERVFAPASDNAAIPLTILRRKDAPADGAAPLHLYGYGSYGSILHGHFSHFNPYRMLLVERGFITVDAHIRGGADKGRQWYLDGKLDKKQNTFSDFIAAAEWLIQNKYTAKGRIVAEGRSAGGLLMGAVANQADPGLFGCMIADVPFVDVMNTILDEKLPLTPPEWEEWGNPITDAAAFDTIRSYSPYDNVARRPYPALFISGGLTDPRVTYWEPAKWVAKLRAYHTGTQPIYLHIAMDSGHGGDPGRFSHLPERARELAFILSTLGGKAGT